MDSKVSHLSRRAFLTSAALLLTTSASIVHGQSFHHGMPWAPGAADPPVQVRPGPWAFFTSDEAATVEAIVDRLIPPDDRSPGGKDVGCAVFIDQQLAGPYGRSDGLYARPPFMPGTATQGYQNPGSPAGRYRNALKALADHVGQSQSGKTFRELSASHLTERYGGSMLPAAMTIQDWPLSYDELESYYDRFEKLCGTSGKACNIKGVKQDGGNPFAVQSHNSSPVVFAIRVEDRLPGYERRSL